MQITTSTLSGFGSQNALLPPPHVNSIQIYGEKTCEGPYRLKAGDGLDAILGKLKGAEVTRADTIASLAVAKERLRVSPPRKSCAHGYLPSLEPYDSARREVLAATKQPSRASAYRTWRQPFLEWFLTTSSRRRNVRASQMCSFHPALILLL